MRTLYRNGRFHAPSVPDATAMLVEDGVITWIGHDDAAGPRAQTTVVDVGDAFVTPAFVDAHVHTTATGLALSALDLSAAASLPAALDLIEKAARSGRGRPILGGGWDESGWPEQRPPTAAELDRAGYGGLVYLARVDAHSAVASSALLAAVPGLAGLAGYRADGYLSRAAHDAVRTAALATLGVARTADLQRVALRAAAAHGIACVHEMAGPAISSADDLAALLALAEAEPLPEVVGYWGELFGVDTALELGAVGAGGDLFCDGSFGSHTAALHEPYADRPDSSGMLRFETADIAEHVLRCQSAGLQTGFHAIGDAAVDQLLDALDLVSATTGRAGGAGHRIEHAEYVDDPQRLAASGLLASMQPMFEATWGGDEGMYATRLGADRAARLNQFAALAAAGVPLAFSSDSPVIPFSPWAAIRAASYPRRSEAAISPRAAFTAHTRAGWRAARRDAGGVLAPGAPATFAIWQAGALGVDAPDDRVSRWSTDLRAGVPGLPDLSPEAELPTCLATVRAGQPIFDAGVIGD